MRTPLLAYLAFVYSLSIALSVLTWLTGADQSPYAFPAGLATMFVPTLATMIVVSTMNAPAPTLKWGRRTLAYLPIAVLLIPVVMHAVMLPVASTVWGGLPWAPWLSPAADGLYHTPPERNWGTLTTVGLAGHIGLNLIFGLLATSALAFFEEVGWRAWMLPRLLEQMTAGRAVVTSSLIWAFWHTPYALSGIHHLPGVPIALVALTLPLVTIGAGLIIGWLWLQTESIWLAALAHGALNNWGQYAFKFMDDAGPGGEARDMLVLAAGGLALIGVGALLLRFRPARRLPERAGTMLPRNT
jgi:membrane protease YdiL (CAAX protease family)